MRAQMMSPCFIHAAVVSGLPVATDSGGGVAVDGVALVRDVDGDVAAVVPVEFVVEVVLDDPPQLETAKAATASASAAIGVCDIATFPP
jgi:hypothetical protein